MAFTKKSLAMVAPGYTVILGWMVMVYSVYDLETQTAETLIALGPGLIIGSGVLYYGMWRIEHNDGKHSLKQLLLCIFCRPTPPGKDDKEGK